MSTIRRAQIGLQAHVNAILEKAGPQMRLRTCKRRLVRGGKEFPDREGEVPVDKNSGERRHKIRCPLFSDGCRSPCSTTFEKNKAHQH